MSPEPNPANNDVKLKFGVGLDCRTDIEIYNNLGKLVYKVVSQDLKNGEYEAFIPLRDLSNGSYFIKMISGPFVKTEHLLINK